MALVVLLLTCWTDIVSDSHNFHAFKNQRFLLGKVWP